MPRGYRGPVAARATDAAAAVPAPLPPGPECGSPVPAGFPDGDSDLIEQNPHTARAGNESPVPRSLLREASVAKAAGMDRPRNADKRPGLRHRRPAPGMASERPWPTRNPQGLPTPERPSGLIWTWAWHAADASYRNDPTELQRREESEEPPAACLQEFGKVVGVQVLASKAQALFHQSRGNWSSVGSLQRFRLARLCALILAFRSHVPGSGPGQPVGRPGSGLPPRR
jgi:hypothetical protein